MTQEQRYLEKENRMCNFKTKRSNPYVIGIDTGTDQGFFVQNLDKQGNSIFDIKDTSSHVITTSNGTNNQGVKKTEKTRNYRSQSRQINRRKNYKRALCRTLIKYHILPENAMSNGEITKHQLERFRNNGTHIYKLRNLALYCRITNQQLATILYYFLNHPGYKNSKRVVSIKGKATKAITEEDKEINNYKTVGQMLDKSSKFKNKKRNTANNYLHMTRHSNIIKEVHLILSTQQRFNRKITPALIYNVIKILNIKHSFDKGPNRNNSKKNNNKRFTGGIQKKVDLDKLHPVKSDGTYNLVICKHTATYEAFRLLQNINHIRVDYKPLNPIQRKKIYNLRFKNKSVTKSQVRKILKLTDKDVSNIDTLPTPLSKVDTIATVGKIISNKKNTALIDKIGTILTFYKTDDCVPHLKDIGLPKKIIKKLLKASTKMSFSGTGSLSKQSINKLMPYLLKGYDISTAKIKSGLTHPFVQKHKITPADIALFKRENSNPVLIHQIQIAKRGINEIELKKGYAPVAIIIEDGRDINFTASKRKKITHQNKQNEKTNKK